MFKASNNPIIIELSKSYKDRRINLSDLKVTIIDGKKYCIWCNTLLSGRQQKWCSEECSNNAFAWANPQKEQGLYILLSRQNWKCNTCQYDYLPLMEVIMKRFSSTIDKLPWYHLKYLKSRTPEQYKPEVDHILAIRHGGQSIGLENCQILCAQCHKAKTKMDNSGLRK